MAALGPADAQSGPQTITEVWLHDIPGPPEGDFWRPVTGNLLGMLINPAAVYPNVVVCAHPLSGGGHGACTVACRHFQGNTKLGRDSSECRRPLRVAAAASDPHFQIEVLDVDEAGGRLRARAVIARVSANPSACSHALPCVLGLPKGALILSFATSSLPGTRPSPPATVHPATPGSSGICQPWHGPYASLDEAMLLDDAGRLALMLAGHERSEWGFVVLRDSKLAHGGYYLTPPVKSSQDPNAVRPMISGDDYNASWRQGIAPTCSNFNDFVLAGTVHTHPWWGFPLPQWDSWDSWKRSFSKLQPVWTRNFTATDFSGAILDKAKHPSLEAIVMINANSRQVRIFVPQPGDQPFSQDSINAVDTYGLPPCPTSIMWCEYANRVTVLTTYP